MSPGIPHTGDNCPRGKFVGGDTEGVDAFFFKFNVRVFFWRSKETVQRKIKKKEN